MALFDTLLPNGSADAVAVFDQNFNQIWVAARPVKINVRESKKVMEHPVETGEVITDHVVIQPLEIELSTVAQSADYRNVYAEIKSYFLKSTLVVVQTRTSNYDQMLISDMPHEEDPALYDAITMVIKLRHVEFVSAQFGTLPPSKVKNPANASTTNRGQQQGADVPPKRKTSAAVSAVDGIGDTIHGWYK